eukprot:601240-Pyramimonas_sp.AAC.1
MTCKVKVPFLEDDVRPVLVGSGGHRRLEPHGACEEGRASQQNQGIHQGILTRCEPRTAEPLEYTTAWLIGTKWGAEEVRGGSRGVSERGSTG